MSGNFFDPFDRVNFVVGCVVFLAFWALLLGCIAHFNATERDRSIACSEAGGSYAEGECEIR